jgi:hypothetical protein
VSFTASMAATTAGRRLPARSAACSAWSTAVASSSDAQCHFAELAARVQPVQCRVHIVHAVFAVDHGLEAGAADKLQQVGKLLEVAVGRADHLQLADEQAPQIGRGLVAAGGAAGDQTAAAHQRLQAAPTRPRPRSRSPRPRRARRSAASTALATSCGGRVITPSAPRPARVRACRHRARSRSPARPAMLGQLQRGQRHAAADAEHQHRLPGLAAAPW